MKNWKVPTQTIILLMVFILLPLSGCFAQPEPKVKIIPIEIRAKDLYKAYEENQISADANYKDKFLRVSGKIYTFGKTTSVKGLSSVEVPYVVLDGGKSDNPSMGLFDIWGTQCIFPAESATQLVDLKKDDMVVIEGKCVGGMMRFIVIANCCLVGVNP